MKLHELDASHHRLQLHPSERGMASSAMRDGQMVVSFCDNDYLGLSQHPRVIAAAGASAIRHGAGAGGSRCVSGDSPLNHELETMLSQMTGLEASRLFGSGYLADIALAPVLVGRGDVVVVDELAKAGLQAGAQLSGAEVRPFRHNDVEHARERLSQNRAEGSRAILITETVFSANGDLAPLAALHAVCEAHDAWMATDDSHGFGVVAQDNPAPIQIGALSKAAGVYGGYVSGPAALMELLASLADPFVQETGLPPQVLGAGIEALKVIVEEPQLSRRVLGYAAQFCRILELPAPQSAIVPVEIGAAASARAIADQLLEEGYYVAAIPPSTGESDCARLRFSFSAAHEEEDVVGVAQTLKTLLAARNQAAEAMVGIG